MKKVFTAQADGFEARVYWGRESEEYVCRFYRGSQLVAAFDYFTDDRRDAERTAGRMVVDGAHHMNCLAGKRA